ncbi:MULTISPECIES: electron transport complex subunit RsxG [Pasteurellaceae]|uniref:Ion-translocating oxidoreductase complex subunit G n=1 Tax=Pasteurella bettyae CCUG 2042 TaxID=1095749 RepID=I3DCH7_9PAST|nr:MULTISPECIES: electron transport complex subunit RsxG [Pasteurellaceae]EIJ69420.1 electron transport complex protein RnfG [Pasteurella bettyae CCUG 2042]SUB21482.1 electron transport complex protein RnfG [Pasteurella bettyae]
MKIAVVTFRYGLLLALVAVICTLVSAGVYFVTKDKIDSVISENQRKLLLEVIPQNYFDNNLVQSCIKSALPDIHKIYLAKKNQQITAYAFETVAHDGYSGDIRILVGLTPSGEVLGVRTIEHHETPGLGDKIDLRISNWILSLTNQHITENNQAEWAVKKDGGKFDQFAGATITPRALINQVKRSALLMLKSSNFEQYPTCN